MLNERTKFIIRLVSTQLLLVPVLLFISVFINSGFYLLATVSQSVLIIIFLAGYWEFLGFRFRLTYSISLELLLLTELIWKFHSDVNVQKNLILILCLSAFQLYLIIEIIRILFVIFFQYKNSYEISFPFRDGKYLITDGGNSKTSRLMNYHFYSGIHRKHNTNYSMLYATDIVRTDKVEKRFFPRENTDYPIFGENVLSPVSGVIFRIVDKIEDNVPYSGKYPYNTGNTVIIRNGNLYMLLGHLKTGSIKVNEGDTIKEKEIIAEVGNSGYSERPHLHMQYVRSETENFWKGNRSFNPL
jgi:hypothetical protein